MVAFTLAQACFLKAADECFSVYTARHLSFSLQLQIELASERVLYNRTVFEKSLEPDFLELCMTLATAQTLAWPIQYSSQCWVECNLSIVQQATGQWSLH